MEIGYFLSSEEWGRVLLKRADVALDIRSAREIHSLCKPDGFDELYVQQIGSDQDAFFEAYAEHVLARVA
ncbi:MAG TPA: hypothetical protein VMF57_01695 [Solirubrobacteraceae bacterium]|nr:hypothetical protein [Solirubrobacteraceae bacterium]